MFDIISGITYPLVSPPRGEKVISSGADRLEPDQNCAKKNLDALSFWANFKPNL